MCIAILNTYSALSRETLSNCWENNFDGAGLLWVNSAGALETFKELNSFKVFFKKYSAVRKETSGPVVLHFRIGTHGNHAEYNLHPFLISPEIGFVHNGVFRLPEIEKKYSDTWHFNSLILQTMKAPARLFKSGTNEFHLINHFCGNSSKLIFLNRKGQFQIFNETAGHWDKSGNWYSNHSYKVSKYIDFGGRKVAKDSKKPAYYGGARESEFDWENEYSRSYYSPYAKSWKSNHAPAPAPAPAKKGSYSDMIEAAENWAKNPDDSRTEIVLPGNPAPLETPAENPLPRPINSSLITEKNEIKALKEIADKFEMKLESPDFQHLISAGIEYHGANSYQNLFELLNWYFLEGVSWHGIKQGIIDFDKYDRKKPAAPACPF